LLEAVTFKTLAQVVNSPMGLVSFAHCLEKQE
jgi:hypothetical protein